MSNDVNFITFDTADGRNIGIALEAMVKSIEALNATLNEVRGELVMIRENQR